MRKPYQKPQNQRLDAEYYSRRGVPCFFTVRVYQHKAPFVSKPLNETVVDVLREYRVRLTCSILAYCLMPDHFHLLVAPNEDGISTLDFVDRFKGRTTKESWKFGWNGRLWQPRSFDHVLRKEESVASVVDYILDNPVRSGLCETRTDYPWAGRLDDFTP